MQLKKDFEWIQPSTQSGSIQNLPSLSFDQILNSAVKVRTKNRWELQIDTNTGQVLQEAYRRSDLIETLHDGSWFNSSIKYLIFLPSGIVLLVLWLTGIYLVLLPYQKKWQKQDTNES